MDDLEIHQTQGFGNKSGFGEHPCLLVVDFVNGFADPAVDVLEEAVSSRIPPAPSAVLRSVPLSTSSV